MAQVEIEREVLVCGPCDEKLDRELAAYLAFVQVTRGG
jgi:hypothetical protein